MVSSADNINRGSDDPRLAFEGGEGVRFGGVAADKAFAFLSCVSVSVNGRHAFNISDLFLQRMIVIADVWRVLVERII